MTSCHISARENCSELHGTRGYTQPHTRTFEQADSTFLLQHKGLVYRARSTLRTRPNMQYAKGLNYTHGPNFSGSSRASIHTKDWTSCLCKVKTSIEDRNMTTPYNCHQLRKNKKNSISGQRNDRSCANQARKQPGILELGPAGLAPLSQRQNYRPDKQERLEQRNYRITKWKESDEHSPNNRTEDFGNSLNKSELTFIIRHKTSHSTTSYKETELRRIRAVRNIKKMEEMIKGETKKVEKLQTTDSGIWCEGASENNHIYSKPNCAETLSRDITISNNRTISETLVDNPANTKKSQYVEDVSISENSPIHRKIHSQSLFKENRSSSRKYNKSLSSFHRVSSEGSLSSRSVHRRKRNSYRSDYYRRKHRDTYEFDSDESTESYERHRSYRNRSYKNRTKLCRFNESMRDNNFYSRSHTFSNYPLQQSAYYNIPNNQTGYIVPQESAKNNYITSEKQLIKTQPKSLLSNCYPAQTIIYQCACGECRKLYSYPCKTKETRHVKFSTKRAQSEQSITSVTSGRLIEMFSVCFRCFDSDEDTLSSGGSDTGSCGGADGDGEEEGYQEHGDGVSLDDGSDGGDSGSESGGEVSLNSAELFDDQNNLFDIKNALGGEDESDDGPGSAGSDCSDSLTELRSRSKKGSGSSDGEGDRDTITEDDFDDSWDSLAIYERE